jgi:hypothetical protein
MAKTSATTMPLCPPSSPPTATSRPARAPRRTQVLSWLANVPDELWIIPSCEITTPERRRGRCRANRLVGGRCMIEATTPVSCRLDREASGRLIAGNRQETNDLLARLTADLPRLAAEVAADLDAQTTPETTEVIVRRLLAAIAAAPRLGEAELRRLRAEGAQAAREGRPLAAPIDAYLSSAWVTWDRAVAIARPGESEALATLASALLRAGDDIAAALSDGYTAAERALARTAGAVTQAVLDELLSPTLRDAAQSARLARRASLVGLDPAASYDVLVARGESELTPESPLVGELSRRLSRDPVRRPHLVAARGGDLVAIATGPWMEGGPFERLTRGLSDGERWWGVYAGPASIDTVANAYSTAIDALRVAPVVLQPGSLAAAFDLALERALVADPALSAVGADRWLKPLESAGRGSADLVPTLEAWFRSGESIVAAARALGVAPRTVSYRLERIARVLGERQLSGLTRERLATALAVRRLLR